MEDISAYEKGIVHKRQVREKRLLSNSLNWFSLIGLFPLSDGSNTVGREEDCDICLSVFPSGSSLVFDVKADAVHLSNASPDITVNGMEPTNDKLRQDVEGEPDLVEIGSIAIRVINRSGRPYLRVWDREAAALQEFHGLRYFPVKADYKVQAGYFPFDPPQSIRIQDAIGGEHEILFPGEVRFKLKDIEYSLIAEDAEDELLFNFTDLTRSDSTYPGGRYLLTEKPENDLVTLDFNLANNWPCAYTPFATCPLPPPQNHLQTRIEAGEMRYHK